tara:strand:+ start:1615 stop:2217 length:603 start_codon:yes stop_codon:yes gene_type:complete
MKNQLTFSYIDSFGVPRCGCPSLVRDDGELNKWGINHLTYFIRNRDDDIEPQDWDTVIEQAFNAWSSVADLSFEKTEDESANVMIDIGKGQEYHFDGPMGTLAWAYLPPKDDYQDQLLMRFDTDEIWSSSMSRAGILLLNVATHEIGHILGLTHSEVPKALMAPNYNPMIKEPQKDDDILRIQSLYGEKNEQDKRDNKGK